MRFELLCCATLAARSRCRLAGLIEEDDELLPPHPAFIAVRRMRFAFENGPAPGAGARSAAEWLEQLREEGLSALWLGLSPEPAVCAVLEEGRQSWEPLATDGAMTLLGRWADLAQPEGSLADSTEALAAALSAAHREALAGSSGADPVARGTLERAAAILASSGDGQEVADTAWPHFILPVEADPLRRRVAAAAASVLPDEGLGGGIRDAALEAVALRALAAAINS